ncbi:MAG TPA: cellulose binding domain-containing protein, partial [Polyangiaceae bacterium]|nr:cellulose binding domain-containing protein [Polyangiaceae bacterium]
SLDGGDTLTTDSGSSAADSGAVDAGGGTTEPPPPDSNIAVHCAWSQDSALTYYFSLSLDLDNNDSAALDLRDIELRYYFSSDGRDATDSVVLNYSPIDSTDVVLAATGAGAPAGADHFVSVTFDGCTTGCSLAAGGSLSGAGVQIGMNSGGSGAFNATNDYSYTPGDDPCELVAVFDNGTLIYGVPPGN